MALIEWREEFCTGVQGVDYEHQELIKQINSIYELIENNADKESVIDSLGDIYGSISAHFALEEQMMERHNYDHFKEHQADHEHLLDDIRDITEEFESATELNKDKFKQQLNDWFQIHFKTHDSRLHSLAHLINHEVVCESTMKTMIRNAKNALLGKKA
ncbi:MAG: hemerythrin family protein [Gammaproteobacteria bacterium]|nr:hemerythrin family protein [Gammaproteobacteria bacterium]